MFLNIYQKNKGNHKGDNKVAVYPNYESPNIVFATIHDRYEANLADLVSFSIANIVTNITTTKK